MGAGSTNPDLFISYSRSDAAKAERLRMLLVKNGWEVWKDERINAGKEFEQEILLALNHAQAVIVLWSDNSCRSPWVLRECALALEQGKQLIPVLIEECQVPSAYIQYEAALLQDWDGEDETFTELEVLYRGITDYVLPMRLDNVRRGFDPYFLGKSPKIMLPEVRGAADLIHYANFSIVMNPVRRMAWYVAYNIDGKAYQEGLPRNDLWMPDPLWPQSLQPLNFHFSKSEWDRGHLLSPGTVCWGNARIAGIARRQANYFTNTSPQSHSMNRKWWLSLEQYERRMATERSKLTGLSGPILGDDDESFRDEYEKDGMFRARETYRIPGAFWKLMIFKKGRQLFYEAYILREAELKTAQGTFRLEDHKVSLERLERETGLSFDEALHALKAV